MPNLIEKFHPRCPLGYSALVFFGLIFSPAGVSPAQTSDAATQAPPAITSGPVEIKAVSAAESTQTILLLGEKMPAPANDKKTTGIALDAIAASVLGGKVVDLTSMNATLASTDAAITQALDQHADLAIVFAGAADEAAETEDAALQASLKSLAGKLRQNNMRVFVAPSAPSVGAAVSANLRIAAGDSGISYIDLGTEMGGRPYEDAFESIKAELAMPVALAPSAADLSTAASTLAPLPQDLSSSRLDAELSRIAGEADQVTTQPGVFNDPGRMEAIAVPGDDAMTSGGERQLIRRGEAARETINMKPLPALKPYRPKIPVPRNETNSKEPGVSR